MVSVSEHWCSGHWELGVVPVQHNYAGLIWLASPILLIPRDRAQSVISFIAPHIGLFEKSVVKGLDNHTRPPSCTLLKPPVLYITQPRKRDGLVLTWVEEEIRMAGAPVARRGASDR